LTLSWHIEPSNPLHILAGNSKKKVMIIFVLKTFGYSFSRINAEENNMFL
jgi:hypothetical protein